MSASDRTIICRRCGDSISRDIGNCPHCGAAIRSRRGPIALFVVGLVILAGTIVDLGQLWPYSLIGLIVAFGGGYMLYDRRQRIRDAGPAESA